MPGPVYGKDKHKHYREAELFVLPSHSENFGMSVAEALAQGTPAIVSQGAPWQNLEHENAGWWVEKNQDAWQQALQRAMSLNNKVLAEMGERGRLWMLRDFSWKHVGEHMHQTYSWVLHGGEPPSWVRTD